MLTGELRNKVDSLWEIFWTGGLANPLDVIEQMTYLMFIHDLDANDNLRAKEAAMLGLPHKSMFAGEVQSGICMPTAYKLCAQQSVKYWRKAPKGIFDKLRGIGLSQFLFFI